jgi:hypothetical protein
MKTKLLTISFLIDSKIHRESYYYDYDPSSPQPNFFILNGVAYLTERSGIVRYFPLSHILGMQVGDG